MAKAPRCRQGVGLRLTGSRAAGFVLIAILSFGVVSIARSFWGPRVERIPEPDSRALEARPRAEIEAARGAASAVLASGNAAQRAGAYGQLGKVYLAYGLSDAAAASFRNAGALDPRAFQWPYLLAKALAAAGQHEAASAAMTAALDRMAKDSQERIPALCFLAESALHLRRNEEARRHLEAAIQLNPRAPYPHIRLGQLDAVAGNPERAASHYERAMASMPGRRELREWLDAQPKSGALPPAPFPYADPIYATVVTLDHSSAALLRAGIEHAARGRRQRALDSFREAVEANPELTAARAYYAEALLDEGNLEKAIVESDRVLRGDPENRRARATLARAYASNPATRDKGIAMAIAMRQEQAERAEPLLMLGAVYTAAGRYADALAVYREAVPLMPRQPAPLLGEGAMLAALGRHAHARAAYEKAAATFPENPSVRLVLARYLVTAPERAARDPQRGLEIALQLLASGGSTSRAETAAIALAANDRFPAAASALSKALSRLGDDADPALRARLHRLLESFRNRQPWTEPWPFHSAQESE